MDAKGSKDKEDGLEVWELEQIPSQAGELVHNLRVAYKKSSQSLKEIEDSYCGPAQGTKSFVFLGKHDWFCVLDLKKRTVPLLINLRQPALGEHQEQAQQHCCSCC